MICQRCSKESTSHEVYWTDVPEVGTLCDGCHRDHFEGKVWHPEVPYLGRRVRKEHNNHRYSNYMLSMRRIMRVLWECRGDQRVLSWPHQDDPEGYWHDVER